MKTNMMSLCDLHVGQSAVVKKVGGEGSLRQHLLDMGITPLSTITKTGVAPTGDPLQLNVRGYSLSLRLSEAAQISVEIVEETQAEKDDQVEDFSYNLSLHEHNSHPGYGEEGKYHSKDHENPLPKDTVLKFALAGQQNCGKTTLFNALTGSNQHVGNFPGVTVDRKDGQIKGHPNTVVTDLPGIYSISTYTSEEVVAREFILKEKPHCIINIVDASNIERNLYLTVQLMELGVPMVLALNMMDEVIGNGGSIRINELERVLGLPVVPISAMKGEGVEELVQHAIHVAKYQEVPTRQDFCDKDEWGGSVHRCLHSIMHLIEDHAQAAALPVRFASSRIVDGDSLVTDSLHLGAEDMAAIEHIIKQMEQERGLDRHAAMAEMRFSFISRLCARTVKRPRESKEAIRSRKIDKVLTGKWTAIPIFVAVMCLVLWLTIDLLGAPLQDLLDTLIQGAGAAIGSWMDAAQVSPAVRGLVVDAIFGGVGSVVSFVPIIVVLFFLLSMLEDSGYMARVAFVTDSILRKIGLSGRSIVPLLIGLGCSVPGVMASRTLPSARDRKKTILLTPFMSCSAKLPIYSFLSASFFPGHGGLVLILLYLLSIAVGIIVALCSKYLGRKGEAAPFVMELPVYRMPVLRNVLHLLWDKTKDFLARAFSIIFIATLAIWVLQSFDFNLRMVEGGEGSILAWISSLIAPVFAPLGLNDWRIVTALLTGFLAKESVVSTMEILGVTASLTSLTAVPLLVFCLLYSPCVAAVAAIKRELGGGWAAFVVVFQCVVAWIVALVAYGIAGLVL